LADVGGAPMGHRYGFAEAGADMVTAITLTSAGESAGSVRSELTVITYDLRRTAVYIGVPMCYVSSRSHGANHESTFCSTGWFSISWALLQQDIHKLYVAPYVVVYA